MDERLRALGCRVYDTARYLDTPERIADYLNEILAANDPELLELALADVARARVMHGLGPEAAPLADQPLTERGRQHFDEVRRVLEALGMKLQVVAA